MSRSYKKAIIQGASDKSLKKIANRKIRKTIEVPNFNKYKRLFESWNMCDIRYDLRFEEKEKWQCKKLLKIATNIN